MLLTYPDVSSLHNFRQNRHTLNQSGANLIFSPRTHSSASDTELGGAERDRTADPLLAKQVLSQLSYSPIRFSQGPTTTLPLKARQIRPSRSFKRTTCDECQVTPEGKSRMVGPGRLELPTSRLSGVRSNHLSYGPISVNSAIKPRSMFLDRKRNVDGDARHIVRM